MLFRQDGLLTVTSQDFDIKARLRYYGLMAAWRNCCIAIVSKNDALPCEDRVATISPSLPLPNQDCVICFSNFGRRVRCNVVARIWGEGHPSSKNPKATLLEFWSIAWATTLVAQNSKSNVAGLDRCFRRKIVVDIFNGDIRL